MNRIIQVRNLSKRYCIGTRERVYKTFREAIIDGVTAPFHNFSRFRKLTHFSDNGDRAFHNQRYVPSTTRAQEELGLHQSIPLRDAVALTMDAWDRDRRLYA